MPTLMVVRTVVVATASWHGSTAEIADRVAPILEQELPYGWVVHRTTLQDLRALDDAAAVVLGSAVHRGRWMESGTRALTYLQSLPPRDVWLYSVDRAPVGTRDLASPDLMVEAACAVEHVVLPATVDRGRRGVADRLESRAGRLFSGTRHSEDEIEQWARHVGGHLRAHTRRYACG